MTAAALLTNAEIDECLLGGLELGCDQYTYRFARKVEAKVLARLAATPPEPLDQPAELPPLPEPVQVSYVTDSVMRSYEVRSFTASQMYAYARAALRSDPVAATPAAWVSPMRYGSQVTFYKPTKPLRWDDEEGAWYCKPLYSAPVAATPASGDAAKTRCGDKLRPIR